MFRDKIVASFWQGTQEIFFCKMVNLRQLHLKKKWSSLMNVFFFADGIKKLAESIWLLQIALLPPVYKRNKNKVIEILQNYQGSQDCLGQHIK